MTLKQQASQGSEVDERLGALMTNANAIRAIAAAVEGTLGPKGLDTMLVDRFGDVVITNDGVTILTRMEANHPAARLLINIARAQEEEVGDGTTTATVMAGQLVATGVELVVKGVPVAKVI
ncbi:MAG: TCP-1/cpn60 chaperonin family protein, partial [Bacillota bacterium]